MQIILKSIHNCISYAPDKFKQIRTHAPKHTPQTCFDNYVQLTTSGIRGNEKLENAGYQYFLLVRKGENAGNEHFLPFSKCFQTPPFLGSLKVGIVQYGVNCVCTKFACHTQIIDS